MKILGIDFGERKIGLAISEGIFASPLKIEEKTKDIEEKIKRLCRKEEVEKIIVGISEGKMALKQREFGRKIANICQLPVEFWDETLTSQTALKKMIEAGVGRKERRREDAFAAALILQSYLDTPKTR